MNDNTVGFLCSFLTERFYRFIGFSYTLWQWASVSSMFHTLRHLFLKVWNLFKFWHGCQIMPHCEALTVWARAVTFRIYRCTIKGATSHRRRGDCGCHILKLQRNLVATLIMKSCLTLAFSHQIWTNRKLDLGKKGEHVSQSPAPMALTLYAVNIAGKQGEGTLFKMSW